VRLSLSVTNYSWPPGPSSPRVELSRLVRRAEEAGLDTVRVSDHLLQADPTNTPDAGRRRGAVRGQVLPAGTSAGQPRADTAPAPADPDRRHRRSRTRPLVAQYADACNLFDIPDGGRMVSHKPAVLAGPCADVGRPYQAIEKTFSTPAGGRRVRCRVCPPMYRGRRAGHRVPGRPRGRSVAGGGLATLAAAIPAREAEPP
jgi:hypothetical protein